VVSTLQDCQISDNKVGTPLYLAPELVKNKKYDFKVDVWAAGVIMYYLTALNPPFSGDSISDLGVSITTTTPKELSNYYTNKYKSLLKLFLSKDPAERPTIDEAIDKVPELIKKAYISQFRFTDVKENNGFISSRDSPLKRADDLPSAVIPIPVYKKTVTMAADKLTRPITTYSKQEVVSRPNTEHENRRLNLKYAVNVGKMRVLSSLNGRTSTQVKEREIMKPTRDKVYIRDIIQCTDETPK
jgi:serine/threonine protein kinase